MKLNPYVTEENLDEKTEKWLREISAYNTHRLKLDRTACALLVIDMQKFFLDPKSPSFTEGGLAIIKRCAELISSFRRAKRPVIFTRHVHKSPDLDGGLTTLWWKENCIEGTEESEIHDALKPLPNEKVVFKHRYNAFYNTDLEIVLRCLNIRDLVICGIMTNVCCESTARDAFMRDFRVFFPADANGSVTEELHLASLKNLAFGFAYVCRSEEITSGLQG